MAQYVSNECSTALNQEEKNFHRSFSLLTRPRTNRFSAVLKQAAKNVPSESWNFVHKVNKRPSCRLQPHVEVQLLYKTRFNAKIEAYPLTSVVGQRLPSIRQLQVGTKIDLKIELNTTGDGLSPPSWVKDTLECLFNRIDRIMMISTHTNAAAF